MEDFDLNTELEDDRMNIESTIFVNNLPAELNEAAIRDIFGGYGKIIHMYYPYNATWTCITYGTYREAELAIRELNNKKPLCLKVSLDKRSLNKESQNSSCISHNLEEKMLATDVSPSFDHINIKYQQSTGRGKSMNGAIRKYSTMSQIAIPHADSESLPCSSYTQASNIYEPEDQFESTNRLWTRGVVTVTPDGKRHVALGRGYTMYEFPEENPKIEEYIEKLYEKRLKGLYEYGEDKFKDKLQKCYVCFIKTMKHCEKCSTYYCSRSCQVKDWPRHQIECERIPALVEETVQNISTLQINKEEEQETKTSVDKTIASNDIKLRRPNTLQSLTNIQSNGTNVSTTERVDQSVSNAVTKDSSQQNQKPKYNSTAGNTDQLKRDEEYSTKADSIRQRYNRIPSTTEKVDHSASNDVTKDSSQQNQKPKYNSTAGNIDQSKRDEEYSTKADSIRQRYNRQNHVANRSYIKDRVDSNIRDGSYNTDKTQSFQRNESQNKKLPPYNSRENANKRSSTSSNTDDDQAFNKDTYLSNKEFTEIEIEVVLDNNEYWISKLKDANACKDLMMQLQNVAKKSRNVKPIIGNIYGVLYEKIWHRAMVISLNPLMVHYIDFGNDEILEMDADIRDIGDLFKIPKFAKKIRLTPAATEKYKNLKYGDKIFVRMLSMNTDGTIIVEVQEQLEDSPMHTKESALQQDMNAMEKTAPQEKFQIPPIINITASKIEIPNILEAFANLLTQEADTELEISGLIQIVESTQKNIYSATLCPQIYADELEMIVSNMQEVCNELEKSANCRPQIDDLVCGKGAHDWSRGYVLTSSDLRIIAIDEAKILSVDQIVPCPKKFLNICALGVVCRVNHPTITLEVGQVYMFSTTMNQQNYKQGSLNIDITVNGEVITAVIKPWESLITKSIPALAELQSGSKQRSCSAKIVLKDVPRDVPMTREADQYLRNLTGKEVPLTCVYEGTPSKDGVRLMMPTGESVNEELDKLLVPNWKQQNDDGERYMLDDIKVASLGRVGDTVEVVVTHVREIGKQYMLSPLDMEVATHFDDVMSPMIKEFCEKTEYYIPRMQELCLALYQGGWYRAACFDPKNTDTTAQIFFLDYGNIESVKHQDIRRMPKDFITPAAMANLCTVVNLAPLDNADNYSPTVEQKIAELVPSESSVMIKIVKYIDNGDYQVEFPEVHAQLIQGNFI